MPGIYPEYRDSFIEAVKKYDLDAVIVMSEVKPTTNENSCFGVAQLESTIYGLGVAARPLGVFTPEGAFSKRLDIRRTVSDEYQIKHPKSLSKYWLNRIGRVISKGVEVKLDEYLSDQS